MTDLASGWIPSDGFPRFARITPIAAPVATVVVLPVLLEIFGLITPLGLWGTAGLSIGLAVAVGATNLLLFNGLVTKAVRPSPDGVGVVPNIGASFHVPWETVTLVDGGFPNSGVLSYQIPRPGRRVLSPAQYAAIKGARPNRVNADAASHP